MQMMRPGSASSTGSLSSVTRYSTATANSAGGGGGRNAAAAIAGGGAVVVLAGAAAAAIADDVAGTHFYGDLINKED